MRQSSWEGVWMLTLEGAGMTFTLLSLQFTLMFLLGISCAFSTRGEGKYCGTLIWHHSLGDPTIFQRTWKPLLESESPITTICTRDLSHQLKSNIREPFEASGIDHYFNFCLSICSNRKFCYWVHSSLKQLLLENFLIFEANICHVSSFPLFLFFPFEATQNKSKSSPIL